MSDAEIMTWIDSTLRGKNPRTKSSRLDIKENWNPSCVPCSAFWDRNNHSIKVEVHKGRTKQIEIRLSDVEERNLVTSLATKLIKKARAEGHDEGVKEVLDEAVDMVIIHKNSRLRITWDQLIEDIEKLKGEGKNE